MRSHTENVYCNWVAQIPYVDKGVNGYSNRGAAGQSGGRTDIVPVTTKGVGWDRGAQLRRWRCARQRGILSTDKISGRMDFAR